MKSIVTEKSSFRDPSGVVFYIDGTVFRQINFSYKDNFDFLLSSGLAKKLIEEGFLLPFKENPKAVRLSKDAYTCIESERIPFISYPYGWSFSQLKDAALLTLSIQKQALDYGMSLKDASAYNIQFYNGKPILIDTLSFKKYIDGKPWVAYRQFCQHFLAPLSLMALTDIRLNQLLKIYMDGIPLDLASALLPKKTWLNLPLLLHIHIHSKSQKKFTFQKQEGTNKKIYLSKKKLLGIIENLEGFIKKLSLKNSGSEWSNYYSSTNYSIKGFKDKQMIIKKYLDLTKPKVMWDLGANIGEFSRIASKNTLTTAFDLDPLAVEKNYLLNKKKGKKNILPLVLDLTNPSPSMGWASEERKSLIERGPVELVMALALIHHLAISSNIPLIKIAEFFSKITYKYLIIEFIPKEDSHVARMLALREDIFSNYQQEMFEKDFSHYFEIVNMHTVKDSTRSIYLMEVKKHSSLPRHSNFRL